MRSILPSGPAVWRRRPTASGGFCFPAPFPFWDTQGPHKPMLLRCRALSVAGGLLLSYATALDHCERGGNPPVPPPFPSKGSPQPPSLPPSSIPAPTTLAPSSPPSHSGLMPLDSVETLAKILALPRALILVCRGFPKEAGQRAREGVEGALASLPSTSPAMPSYVIDESSTQVPALIFMQALGVTSDAPFVVIMEDFKATRRKYLMEERGVPTAAAVGAFIARQGAKGLKPVLLGQSPPPGNANPSCSTLVEVVSDTFPALVLDPPTPVLLLLHRRTCEACKAFSPRYRMFSQLCARSLPGLRVAAMDAGENDVDATHVPETYTPVLRLFLPAPAKGVGGGSSKDRPPSALLDTRVVSKVEGSEGEEQVRITLPTLPTLLRFVQTHSGGALTLPPGAIEEAEALEEEAAMLEVAFDQLMGYLKLWRAHTDVVEGMGEGGGGGMGRAGEGLKALILEGYNFIVKEAKEGDSDRAWSKLDAIAAYVEHHGISRAVAKAAEVMKDSEGK